MPGNNTILAINALCLTLGEARLLQDVSFQLNIGEYVSVIGPNGAGKSTLLKCLNRLQDAWTGQILLKGQDLRQYGRRELARHLGYVPQTLGALPDYSVEDYVALSRYAWQSGFFENTETAIVEEALELTETAQLRHRLISTLSGGEMQKVSIAAAVAQHTDIVLLDEPTSYLDPKMRNDVQALLKRLNQEKGLTIVAVTHDLNSAAQSSDRLLALKKGRLVLDGPPKDVMSPASLDDLYDTRFTYASRPDGSTIVV